MEHIETLFLRTLEDLETRIASQDPYVILGASALIRKLLVDDYPLIDQSNRKYRLKLTFEVTELPGLPPGLPEPVYYSVQDGIYPDTAPPFLKRRSATRDQLLAYVLARVNGRAYTLLEIVQFEANVMGGIHAGAPKEEKEHVLQQINNHVAFGGLRFSLRQLLAIGRVILKGLAPLWSAIR